MINEYIKLFCLTPGATLNDVKKTYRRLAGQNHPDHFTNHEQKKKQEKIMARINEAYKIIAAGFDDLKKKAKAKPAKDSMIKKDSDRDAVLYKKGLEYFNKYYTKYHYFFTHFSASERHTADETEDNLAKAKSFFTKVLREYPESDWAFDSEEKLKKIEKMLARLDENSNGESQTLPRKDHEFYYQKFKDMYKK